MLKTIFKTISLNTVLCVSLLAEQSAVPDNTNYQTDTTMSTTLDGTVTKLTTKLLNSSRIKAENLSDILITSFSNIDQSNKSTLFGKTISESLFNELFTRGINVTDNSVNAISDLKLTYKNKNTTISTKYILIGNYSILNNKLLINSRILNNISGEVIASARIYYNSVNNCQLLENCRKIPIVSHDSSIANCSILTSQRVANKNRTKRDSKRNTMTRQTYKTISLIQ